MYVRLLKTMWLSARWVVLAFVVLCFAVPLLSVYLGVFPTDGMGEVARWLMGSERIGFAIPVVALLMGGMLGIGTWQMDKAAGHVYAMSLPVSRPQYVWLRFRAGATLLALPVAALGLGATIAALSVHLPAGIHAYPVQLTLRFALAVLVCYAIVFSLAVATRRGVLTMLGAIGAVLAIDVLSGMLTGDAVNVTGSVIDLLTTWPGPLAILMGRWALFDV